MSVKEIIPASPALNELLGIVGFRSVVVILLGEASIRSALKRISALPQREQLLDVDRLLIKQAWRELRDKEKGLSRREKLYSLFSGGIFSKKGLSVGYYQGRIQSRLPAAPEWVRAGEWPQVLLSLSGRVKTIGDVSFDFRSSDIFGVNGFTPTVQLSVSPDKKTLAMLFGLFYRVKWTKEVGDGIISAIDPTVHSFYDGNRCFSSIVMLIDDEELLTRLTRFRVSNEWSPELRQHYAFTADPNGGLWIAPNGFDEQLRTKLAELGFEGEISLQNQ